RPAGVGGTAAPLAPAAPAGGSAPPAPTSESKSSQRSSSAASRLADGEGARLFTSGVKLPHLLIRLLQALRKSFGVEQPRRGPVGLQPRPKLRQQLRFPRQPERQVPVLFDTGGDQFRQP